FLAGLLARLGLHLRGLVEYLTRFRELCPGAAIVGVPNPDVEVGVDPGTWEESRERFPRPLARLRHRDRPQLGVVRETLIQGAEERPAAALEMLPGVFAVQNHENRWLFPTRPHAGSPTRFRQTRDEVVGCRVRAPARVLKADRVRQHVVAEP